MKKALGVILTTVTLDAVGVGLVLPIIPRLLREVGHTSELGWRFGAFLALYALMQFACAPILGAFSDRFGRRPVLLVSLAGAAIDYLFLALAPSFWWLFVGRAIAGLTGASGAVASAYIADITPAEHLTRRFGYLSACFGLGFIAGPVIGGLLGDVWVRAPFLAAAALNGLNFLVALLVLPESHKGRGGKIELSSFNPLGPLRWAFSFPALLPLLATFLILAVVGDVGGTVWVLYGEDKFAWNGLTIGVSLAGFGLFHALAQAFVAGPVSERRGEKRALAIGIVADMAAYVAIAFATRGWMAFLLFPLFCLGGIGGPALQSLLSSRAGEAHQRERRVVGDRAAADQPDLFRLARCVSRPGLAGGRGALPAVPAGVRQPRAEEPGRRGRWLGSRRARAQRRGDDLGQHRAVVGLGALAVVFHMLRDQDRQDRGQAAGDNCHRPRAQQGPQAARRGSRDQGQQSQCAAQHGGRLGRNRLGVTSLGGRRVLVLVVAAHPVPHVAGLVASQGRAVEDHVRTDQFLAAAAVA
jgi:DHA1 family tetracycline resistance protein-like MFS transporter